MPPKKPLDKQFIEEKGMKRIPALDPKWMSSIDFLVYQKVSSSVAIDKASEEEWLHRMSLIEDDLHWLLQQPHNIFWSQVIFDPTLHQFLDSYLQGAPRFFDQFSTEDMIESCKEKQEIIHRLVFFVYLRMSTEKEDKEHFITPSVFGDILYENYLFDIPKLMDLCILYGGGNSALLSKMIKNIFLRQPKYEDDLFSTIPTITKLFDNIKEKCGLKQSPPTSPMKPQLLSSGQKSSLLDMSPQEVEDVILYLTDIAVTLYAFLDTYSPASKVFHHTKFILSVASLFESVFPDLQSFVEKNQSVESSGLKKFLKKKLKLAKSYLLKVCRTIISVCCLEPIYVENMEGGTVQALVEDYLQTITSVLPERRFMYEYEKHSKTATDVDMISRFSKNIDKARKQFILESIDSICREFGSHRPTVRSKPATKVAAPSNEIIQDAFESIPPEIEEQEFVAGASARRVEGPELDSLVTSVKDLLPDLGQGFIAACLHEYNYQVEDVIHRILEDKLLPSLQKLDRTMTEKPKRSQAVDKKDKKPVSLLAERHNIYDRDEFDVFNTDQVDQSKIHFGKKKQPDVKDFLNDKSELSEMKTWYTHYDQGSEFYGLYDDEYDDTYDSHDVGAADADSADELTSRRPFTIPRVLGGAIESSSESESSSSESDEKAKPPIREEEQNAAEQNRRGKKQNTNAKGQAKDKGQSGGKGGPPTEADTKQRKFKEKHKGSVSNHNRKMLSGKKMGKGMSFR